MRRRLSIAMVAAVAATAQLAGPPAAATTPPEPPVAAAAATDPAGPSSPTASAVPTLALGKSPGTLSPRLRQLAQAGVARLDPRARAAQLGLPVEGPGSFVTSDTGSVLVAVRVRQVVPAAVAALRRAGAAVTNVSEELRQVTAAVAPDALAVVAAVDGVEYVEEVLAPIVHRAAPTAADGGAVTAAALACPTGQLSEGDAQLNAGTARSTSSVDGTGVTVGVLSDSYNSTGGALVDVAAGELPGPTNPCGHLAPVSAIDSTTGA